MARPLRALVVYPFLFHYRYGVFKALDSHEDLDLTFVSDTVGRNGIAAIPTSMVREHRPVTTRVRSRFTWQSGLIGRVIRADQETIVFHGDMWALSTWVAAAIARARRRRVFFWTIGWHRPDNALLRPIRLAFYRLAHELLIYGNVGRDIGTSMGYPRRRMHVIYNSHESSQALVSSAQSPRVELLPSSQEVSIGAVIRLTEVKRLDLLLRAAAMLRQQGREVRVVLAGEGPARDRLEGLARQLSVDVVFLGAVYAPEELEQFYQAVRVTVVPAAAGLTVIQSLSHGVPVITDDDDYGQMPEAEAVRDGITGGRFPKGDVPALARSIGTWLDKTDADTDAVAGAARREVTERWTPESQADRIRHRLLLRGGVH